jgi:rhodanese-related sulfurtransferase
MSQPSSICSVAPADPTAALAHFSATFRFETDCWDVHVALSDGTADFVLLDVRGQEAFARGHIGEALNVPYRQITADFMDQRWPMDTVFVVYCAGPHCNGAHRAAIRVAELNRPVKMMIGGIAGWIDEGFPLITGPGNEISAFSGRGL